MYENTKKRNKIKGASITHSYIWHINISKCVNYLDTYSLNMFDGDDMCYQTQVPFIFIVFFRHRAVFTNFLIKKQSPKSKIRLFWKNFG